MKNKTKTIVTESLQSFFLCFILSSTEEKSFTKKESVTSPYYLPYTVKVVWKINTEK